MRKFGEFLYELIGRPLLLVLGGLLVIAGMIWMGTGLGLVVVLMDLDREGLSWWSYGILTLDSLILLGYVISVYKKVYNDENN
jgi:hypothetical protein